MTGIQYNNKILVRDDKILTLRDEVVANLVLYPSFGRIDIVEIWRHGKMLLPTLDPSTFPINLTKSDTYVGPNLIREGRGSYISSSSGTSPSQYFSSNELQSVPWKVGQDYTFTFKAKFNKNVTRRVWFGNWNAPETIFSEYLDFTPEWKTYNIHFTYTGIPMNQHYNRFNITVAGDVNDCTLYVKDVALYEGHYTDLDYVVHKSFMLGWSYWEYTGINSITANDTALRYNFATYVPGDTHIYITINYGKDWSVNLDYHF